MKSLKKKIPNNPGVYWFLKNGKRIYVGKAGSLQKRVASYFRNKDPRIAEMVSGATNISFKKTASVLEATILEANLIKKYFPKYNVKEKDNRSFVYLIIPKGDFPRPFIARGREVEKFASEKNVFGPFQSYKILKTVFNLSRRIFPFSTCKPLDGTRGKPCFDYQIGLCPGVCIGAISKSDYQKNIKNLILFFKGDRKRLIKKLKKENPEKIIALKYVEDISLIKNSKLEIGNSKFPTLISRVEGFDISHFYGSEPVGAMSVFTNGESDNAEYRLFKIKFAKNKLDDLEMMREIISRRFNHPEWPKPDVIVVDGGRNQVLAAKETLAEKNIFIPIVGIAKVLGHSGRASVGDKLVFENSKPRVKKLLMTSRQVFQQVRNEVHRFAISFQRKRRSIKIKSDK